MFFQYKEETDVAIIAVDVWEQEENKEKAISSYLEDNEWEFPIFYDADDLIPRKAGIVGLPTTVVLDKEGKIRFLEVGFTNEPEYFRNIVDRITLLQNEDNIGSIIQNIDETYNVKE